MTPSSMTAICVRSAIWRTNISRSTFSRRARKSPSVIIVGRLRYGSRYSLRPPRSFRSLRSYRSFRSRRLRLRSLRSGLAGRSTRSRFSRTLTTVITPSSSTVSPATTSSPVARRRRRRRWVPPSEPSSVVTSSELTSFEFSVPVPSVEPGLRRPRPPRRRRLFRFPRSSESSFVDVDLVVVFSFLGASVLLSPSSVFLRTLLEAAGVTGAA
ncbi:unannotated protein [freshwater metagenome]|uniref:Unannotated protein n=1 Tax=freshwater metagenome TaxID=449393 RepID=A0A6J6J8D0_9ZZZZ